MQMKIAVSYYHWAPESQVEYIKVSYYHWALESQVVHIKGRISDLA